MIWTIFIAVAGALVVQSFLSIAYGADAWRSRSAAIEQAAVAAPLAVSLFALAGLRYLFRLPVELRANWVFRIDGGISQARYQPAVLRFLHWWGVLPVIIVALPLEIAVLGPWSGVAAAALCLVCSLILVELLLLQFPRVPFTSAYSPGKRPLIETVLAYGIAVTLYVSALGTTIVYCVKSPLSFALFATALVAVRWRIRRGREDAMRAARIEFDDLPEPEVRTLSIDRD